MRWSIKEKEKVVKPPVIGKKGPQLGDRKEREKFAWAPIITKDKKTKIWLENYREVYEYKEDKRPIGVKGTEYESFNWGSFRQNSGSYSQTVTKHKKYEWETFYRWMLIDIK